LGLRRALLPASAPPAPAGVHELRATSLREALHLVGIHPT
jgi:hypothetical protein